MGGGSISAKDYPLEYLSASAFAAAINYPLWRASAVGQSGFQTSVIEIAGRYRLPNAVSPYVYAFAPPYKGMVATVLGMTWARASIFWGSDVGRDVLKRHGYNDSVATVAPPLIVSTLVQVVNMPLIRATITIQNPQSDLRSVSSAVRYIYQHHGFQGLYHGLSAGILKTVPKYCTAVVVKELMETHYLAPIERDSPTYHTDRLWRSAYKSVASGVAGAALTNPLDVIRNEMFKTNHGFIQCVEKLQHEYHGPAWLARGLGKNLIAVAVPVACTIFFTDAFIQISTSSSASSHGNHSSNNKSRNLLSCILPYTSNESSSPVSLSSLRKRQEQIENSAVDGGVTTTTTNAAADTSAAAARHN